MPGARASRGRGPPDGKRPGGAGLLYLPLQPRLCGRPLHRRPEEPREAPKSTQASARRVCPAGGTPPRPDGCSPTGVPESGSPSKGQRQEATCSARARPAAAEAPPEPTVARLGRQAEPSPRSPSSLQAAPGHSRPPASSAARPSAQSPAPAAPAHCRQPRRPPRPPEPPLHPRPPQGPDTLLFRGVHSRPDPGGRPHHASSPERTWQRHPFLVPTWH